jgi:hypothetical protein
VLAVSRFASYRAFEQSRLFVSSSASPKRWGQDNLPHTHVLNYASIVIFFWCSEIGKFNLDVSRHGWQGAQPSQVELSCNRASMTTHLFIELIVDVTKCCFVRWCVAQTPTVAEGSLIRSESYHPNYVCMYLCLTN